MKQIYLLKRIEYRNGQSLNPHTPYKAVYNDERNLWFVNGLAIPSKYVEKMEDPS